MTVFCAAIYKHTSITRNAVFPCCRTGDSLFKFDGKLDQVLDNPAYVELRQQMEQGNLLPQCAKCLKDEQAGRKSWRLQHNERWGRDTTVELKDIEIAFDNICNLHCVGCDPLWSSEWGKQLNPDKSRKEVTFSSPEFQVPDTVRRVKFLGGEPLMTRRHEQFLEMADRKQLAVQYVTNGTHTLSDRCIELLHECREVQFNVSIDAWGELNEQIRPGRNAEWWRVEQFVDRLQTMTWKTVIQTVVHRLNVWHLKPLESWILSRNLDWDVRVLHEPQSLSILLCDTRDQLIAHLDQLTHPSKLYIQTYLKEN